MEADCQVCGKLYFFKDETVIQDQYICPDCMADNAHQVQRMRFEYKLLPQEFFAELNDIGAEGWELLFLKNGHFYFKRELI